MHARVVGSRAGCDDDDRAAHPPLGNCFSANSTRRSWTSTSLVVTMALLYCRAPILSNCVRRTLVVSSTGFANSAERGAQWRSPPKVRMAEFPGAVLGNVKTGSALVRPPPGMHTEGNFLPTHHDPEGAQWKGSVPSQFAYSQECFEVRSGGLSPTVCSNAPYRVTTQNANDQEMKRRSPRRPATRFSQVV